MTLILPVDLKKLFSVEYSKFSKYILLFLNLIIALFTDLMTLFYYQILCLIQ